MALSRQPSVVPQLKRIRCKMEGDDGDDGDDGDKGNMERNSKGEWGEEGSKGQDHCDPVQVPSGLASNRSSNWRFSPDALLLVHFFIRTTQLDLLERKLRFSLSLGNGPHARP
ncbi:hypothetical protein BCR44DRAFT_93822 [Catenaria anguillulae PL171]|uniref:Uncharacterized protein n=1 Tax=Catenaria anguillulae PL171 TaxID=765915 RepID=A0A1Y2HNI4_9FUNG|nr:hypothetical protein BCR44DRAFT_93822 [Catenaria anguillulae PL171]